MSMIWQKVMDAPVSSSITYVGASTGYALDSTVDLAPLSFHASTAAGDLAVVWLRTDDSAANKNVPSGWTLIDYTNTTSNTRAFCIAKVLASGDISSPPNLLTANDTHAWICFVFRGGSFSTITANDLTKTNSGSAPSSVISSSGGVAPVIAFGFVSCKNDYTGDISLGGSEDAVVAVNGNGSGNSNVSGACRIFNSSPADVTRAAWTGATDNATMEFYLNG
jgi:hypothetical protein